MQLQIPGLNTFERELATAVRHCLDCLDATEMERFRLSEALKRIPGMCRNPNTREACERVTELAYETTRRI